MTLGSLCNYYRNEVNDDANKENDPGNYRINSNKTATSKFFEYKTKKIGSTPDANGRLDAEVVVPLNYLNKIELDLSFDIISEISRTNSVRGDNPTEEKLTTEALFQVNSTKLYVPIVTFSINDNMITNGADDPTRNYFDEYSMPLV